MKTKNLTIFIVEDDKFFSNLVKERLLRSHYEDITIFQSGESFLKRLHESPDIVILDYHLDEVSGLDILREIKGINPNIQVIFLSAQEEMNVAVNSLKYGAYDYLEKNEEGLQRLLFLIERIVRTNELVNVNKKWHLAKRLCLATSLALVGLFIIFILWRML